MALVHKRKAPKGAIGTNIKGSQIAPSFFSAFSFFPLPLLNLSGVDYPEGACRRDLSKHR